MGWTPPHPTISASMRQNGKWKPTIQKISGIVLLVGGVLLLIGFKTRLAALGLFAALIPITIVIHVAPDHVGPLLKNVAILGGLIHFLVCGPGHFSVDEYKMDSNARAS